MSREVTADDVVHALTMNAARGTRRDAATVTEIGEMIVGHDVRAEDGASRAKVLAREVNTKSLKLAIEKAVEAGALVELVSGRAPRTMRDFPAPRGTKLYASVPTLASHEALAEKSRHGKVRERLRVEAKAILAERHADELQSIFVALQRERGVPIA